MLWDGTEVLYWDTVDTSNPNNHNEWITNYDGDLVMEDHGVVIHLVIIVSKHMDSVNNC